MLFAFDLFTSWKEDSILIHFISSVIEFRFQMMIRPRAYTAEYTSNFEMRLSGDSLHVTCVDDVVNSFRYNNKNKSRRWLVQAATGFFFSRESGSGSRIT